MNRFLYLLKIMNTRLTSPRVLFLSFICSLSLSHASSLEHSPRSLVHLMNYLAADYAGAVSHGEVLDQGEYSEQKEFAGYALEIAGSLTKDSAYLSVKKELFELQRLIDAKAEASLVSRSAIAIKNQVLEISKLAKAPSQWPSLKNGKRAFEGRCASCHGLSGAGDGPAGVSLDPKPRNLLDDQHMKGLSGFHIFNVIKLGIPGTGMAASSDLSESQIWDLSFYVLSMRSKNAKASSVHLSLDDMATLTDEQIEAKLQGADSEKKQTLAALRLKSGDDDDHSSLKVARTQLDLALRSFRDERRDESKKLAVAAYLEGVEPVEPKLRATNSQLTSELELAMANVRSIISTASQVQVVEEAIRHALVKISEAEAALQSRETSFWMTFSMAAGIVFREGFEAILVILAILGVLRGASAGRAIHYVHGGWISALFLGVIAWFSSGWALMVTGAQRELSEGIASLLAVLVLLYMGFWLHSKTEIRRWTAFINGRVKASLEGKSRWGLFVLSFIAVFREAFETVLFMRALTLDGSQSSELAMLLGVSISFLSIFVMAWAFFRFSVNLPVRRLFAISSSIMVGLSIILVGKGLHSFQEVGLLPMTSVSLPLEFPVVGIFSTRETLLAQTATIFFCALIWFFMSRSTESATASSK